MFLVPKPSGKDCHIIDLSQLNWHVEDQPFHMETAQLVLAAMKEAQWATSIDLRDAYFQIPIHPAHQTFWQFFGTVERHAYLDDWICVSRPTCQADQSGAAKGSKLGLVSRKLGAYPDITVCVSGHGTLRPAEKMVASIMDLTKSLARAKQVSAQKVLGLLVKLISVAAILPYGMLRRRKIQFILLDLLEDNATKRHLSRGLESCTGNHYTLRNLDSWRTQAHKPAGATGNVQSSRGTDTEASRALNSCVVRQQDCR